RRYVRDGLFFASYMLYSDRSKKLGFNEYIQSDPCKFEHHDIFKYLQTATLDFQLSDLNCSLGWLSPGQSYVLQGNYPKC
ncbi:unnamed protein product, partial [Didymodactylos carnosus]